MTTEKSVQNKIIKILKYYYVHGAREKNPFYYFWL